MLIFLPLRPVLFLTLAWILRMFSRRSAEKMDYLRHGGRESINEMYENDLKYQIYVNLEIILTFTEGIIKNQPIRGITLKVGDFIHLFSCILLTNINLNMRVKWRQSKEQI